MKFIKLICKRVLLFGKDKVLAHCSVYIFPTGNSFKLATGVEPAAVFCEQRNYISKASSEKKIKKVLA